MNSHNLMNHQEAVEMSNELAFLINHVNSYYQKILKSQDMDVDEIRLRVANGSKPTGIELAALLITGVHTLSVFYQKAVESADKASFSMNEIITHKNIIDLLKFLDPKNPKTFLSVSHYLLYHFQIIANLISEYFAKESGDFSLKTAVGLRITSELPENASGFQKKAHQVAESLGFNFVRTAPIDSASKESFLSKIFNFIKSFFSSIRFVPGPTRPPAFVKPETESKPLKVIFNGNVEATLIYRAITDMGMMANSLLRKMESDDVNRKLILQIITRLDELQDKLDKAAKQPNFDADEFKNECRNILNDIASLTKPLNLSEFELDKINPSMLELSPFQRLYFRTLKNLNQSTTVVAKTLDIRPSVGQVEGSVLEKAQKNEVLDGPGLRPEDAPGLRPGYTSARLQ